jgi:hypothetical protein
VDPGSSDYYVAEPESSNHAGAMVTNHGDGAELCRLDIEMLTTTTPNEHQKPKDVARALLHKAELGTAYLVIESYI